MPKPIRSLFIFCACISACIYLFCATKTLPYLHPDEHFQIVEFASYKMGITKADDLAWEFKARIRPAFQPFLCYHIFKRLIAVGIEDHYAHLFVLRLLTALLSLFAVCLFCYSNLSTFSEKHQKIYILFTFLFWLPYFYGVRFASEAWSGDLTLIAVSLLLLSYDGRFRSKGIVFFVAGLLFGFAFLCRFHTAFFAIGTMLWMFFVRKEKLTNLLVILVGVFAVVALGVLVDKWFYGEWVCTAWAYFDTAFLHPGKDFGSSPFYFYILLMLGFLTPPIGILVFLSLAVLLFRQPRNLYVWIVIPFIIIHSLISHKEPRFMYPVYYFLPVAAMSALAFISKQGMFSNWGKALRVSLWSILIGFNFLFLLLLVLLSSYIGFDPKIFSLEVHKLAAHDDIGIYYKDGNADPYILPKASISKDIFPEYLREKNVKDIEVSSYCQLPWVNKATTIIATSKYDLERDSCDSVLNKTYQVIDRTSPEWLENLPIERLLGKGVKDELDRNIYLLLREKK
jgi:phosphatidylinositol glycan class B